MTLRKKQLKNSKLKILKKKASIRKKVKGTAERPRLTITKSLKHIYGQIIDDVAGKTLGSASTLSKEIKETIKGKKKVEVAFIVGEFLGKKAKEKNINAVNYDRNGNIYHGRVKSFIEGFRKAIGE